MSKKRLISGVKTVRWLAAGVLFVFCSSVCGYNLEALLFPEKENED